ncbi:AAA family ATPase [Nocardioides zeae]|uniref:AAA family ATPase n=1 Tax=Nocardioides imazamoxiresistens TaxID=3231893 RepID=A0ABU3PQU1_9ACTN|nr:AAA family ATPase [Nocardioides zeae]MDT9591601.1 AAA family ATPase [Nocardioides zeae]
MSDDEIQILGVHIPAYKNLVDVWIPWHDAFALVGANGAGKSNVLEALTLLAGSDESVAAMRDRANLAAIQGASLIVANDSNGLPGEPADFDDEVMAAQPALAQVRRDQMWWRREGVAHGLTFAEAVAAWELPDEVKIACLAASARPLIQYTLVALKEQTDAPWVCPHCGVGSGGMCHLCGANEDFVASGSPTYERLYRRTLLTRVGSTRIDLADASNASPAFAVAGEPVAGLPDLQALVELPLTNQVPCRVQRLPPPGEFRVPRLERAFDEALAASGPLIQVMEDRLPVTTPISMSDMQWWLHEVVARHVNTELSLTQPSLYIESYGGSNADWRFGVEHPDGQRVELGEVDGSKLGNLSAGQRRWMDEALASAMGVVEQLRMRLTLFGRAANNLEDEVVFDALARASDVVVEAERDFSWSNAAIDRLLQELEPALVKASREVAGSNPTVTRRAVFEALLPELRHFEEKVVIRVFDEPEAHLHVGAQNSVARALESLRRGGQNVVIASHSPTFLDLPDWTTFRLTGGQLQQVPSIPAGAGSPIASDLGLTRGELLSGIGHILIVEGLHDQLFLEANFGLELREQRVAVIRMHGTSNLLATAELDFIDRYLDVPVTVMLDYSRADRISNNALRNLTNEEKAVRELKKACRSRGRRIDVIGLRRPDIVCYISEAAIRSSHPNFPGWAKILERFAGRRSRPPFKPWLEEQFGIGMKTPDVRAFLSVMQEQQLSPAGEVVRTINEFLAHA